jgi:hypothetical protein
MAFSQFALAAVPATANLPDRAINRNADARRFFCASVEAYT